MANAKKPVTTKKPTATKAKAASTAKAKPAAARKTTVTTTTAKAKAPVKRSATTTAKKTAATPTAAAKATAQQPRQFLSARPTRETGYWLVFSLLILALGVWVLTLTIKINDIYDQIEINDSALSSQVMQKAATDQKAE